MPGVGRSCGVGVAALAIVFSTSDVDAQAFIPAAAADVILTGEADGDGFGHRVFSIGDADGDGIDDIFVAARFNDAGGKDAGRCYLYSGADFKLIGMFTGEGAGDELGHRTAIVGDVNGDDHADIAIGAYVNDGNGIDAGRVYVYSGADRSLLFKWTGEAEGDEFGFGLEPAGDMDGDGNPEILVSGWLNDDAGINAGKIYVYNGDDGDEHIVLSGEREGDSYGHRLASVGDVNDDQRDDFVVGAYRNDEFGNDAGKAYLIDGDDGDVIFEWAGERAGAGLGKRVAAAGDVNNDGTPDILVASFEDDRRPGQVLVFSGDDGSILHRIVGQHAGDEFGTRMRSAGDIDQDDHDDILIGAPKNMFNGENSGRAYLISGRTGDLIYGWEGDSADDRFGRTILNPGDLNGDGWDDIVIGASGHDLNGVDSGCLYLFSGRTGARMAMYYGDDPFDEFAHTVRPAGDLNGDGLPDLCVGAVRGRNEFGVATGRAYILYSHPVYLGTSRIIADDYAAVDIGGAGPNEPVIVFASVVPAGDNPVILPRLGGLVLDIGAPAAVAAELITDQDGIARGFVRAQPALEGYTLYIQAAIVRGEDGIDSVKTNMREVVVEPAR